MKRMMTGMVVGALLTSAGFAWAGKGHPNIQRARKACNNAISALNAAQNANEFDLGGHAAAAKDKLSQAMNDIDEALKQAQENGEKK